MAEYRLEMPLIKAGVVDAADNVVRDFLEAQHSASAQVFSRPILYLYSEDRAMSGKKIVAWLRRFLSLFWQQASDDQSSPLVMVSSASRLSLEDRKELTDLGVTWFDDEEYHKGGIEDYVRIAGQRFEMDTRKWFERRGIVDPDRTPLVSPAVDYAEALKFLQGLGKNRERED